mmetsp:Transcript_1564/g.1757  ORF Transcript_1564/g.1757 Transcript_1564/m.1757 type:complete len:256 (+) Transcript_1564:36-803(+)
MSKEYRVEAILGERRKRNRTEYEVSWDGYTETTWEPAENLEANVAFIKYLSNKEVVPSKLTVVQLRKELAKRGRATTGRKSILLGRLERVLSTVQDRSPKKRKISRAIPERCFLIEASFKTEVLHFDDDAFMDCNRDEAEDEMAAIREEFNKTKNHSVKNVYLSRASVIEQGEKLFDKYFTAFAEMQDVEGDDTLEEKIENLKKELKRSGKLCISKQKMSWTLNTTGTGIQKSNDCVHTISYKINIKGVSKPLLQ